ncbi:inorganic phosphate transporter [Gemmata sp.]|uniref:inorganic phosphate transporter n=1 Tax=Gemmata sp. TaxID=1914242 RepID=UPI003F6EB41D
MNFWHALSALDTGPLVFLAFALLTAFAFEFINGFHDTANAVTTVIYTRSMPATPAVLFSGFMNFLGVLLGGTAVAFGIVNLLPVDLLVHGRSGAALVMVLSLLLAGVTWNLGTWYLGLPVSSSHTLIGSILGVGIANSLWNGAGLTGVNWRECEKVGLALFLSPLLGFVLSGVLLLLLRVGFRSPRLYSPPQGDDRPPGAIRAVLIATCGGVSFAHGSNDGQKGMGLLLLVLIGFFPLHYALTVNEPESAPALYAAAGDLRADYARAGVPVPQPVHEGLSVIEEELKGKASFDDLPRDKDTRWEVRQAVMSVARELKQAEANDALPAGFRRAVGERRKAQFLPAVEYVPLWVVIGTALALGIGTTVGYKRIVETVAEKIGKTHLTYGQGVVAQTATASIIVAASHIGLPVSTTQVLSSAVAGSMVANRSGVQGGTVAKIFLAWVLTLPACMALAALLFTAGRLLVG